MVVRFLLDTNAVIYIQKGLILDPLPLGHYFASIITEIELLSFPTLEEAQRRALIQLLSEMFITPVDSAVRDHAVELRRVHRLSIPDSIIAATAIVLDAELVTNDLALIDLPKIRSRSMRLKAMP